MPVLWEYAASVTWPTVPVLLVHDIYYFQLSISRKIFLLCKYKKNKFWRNFLPDQIFWINFPTENIAFLRIFSSFLVHFDFTKYRIFSETFNIFEPFLFFERMMCGFKLIYKKNSENQKTRKIFWKWENCYSREMENQRKSRQVSIDRAGNFVELVTRRVKLER